MPRWFRLGLVPFVLAVALATPASAAVTNLIPADVVDDSPTDAFTTDMGIEAIGTSTLRGADICIVSSRVTEPGDNSLTCEKPALGAANPLITLGTFFLPLEPPPLKPGSYRLLADGGFAGAEPDKLSIPFTVTTCDDCDPAPALSTFTQWKASAQQMTDSAAAACTVMGLIDTAGQAQQAVALVKGAAAAPTRMAIVPIGGGIVIGDLLETEVYEAMLDKYRAVLQAVTCRTQKMFQAIVDDPADPNYTVTEDEVFSLLPLLGDADVNALTFGMDRLSAAGALQVKAVERFQGAVNDANAEWMGKQAAVAGDAGTRMAHGLRLLSSQLDAFAAVLDAGGNPDVPLTQSGLNAGRAFATRIRDDGFTADEQEDLAAAGLDGQEIADLATTFGEARFTDAAVGTSIGASLRGLADTFAEQAEEQDRFARAMLDVAPRQAPAELTAAITTPTAFSQLVPYAAHLSAESSRPGASPIASYHWDFGDGETDTGITTTHLITEPGTHTVTLTVTDENGQQATRTLDVQTMARSSLQLPNCHDESGAQQFKCPGYDELPVGGALSVGGSGPQDVTVEHTDRNGAYSNGLFWFRVDDPQGGIDGVSPGEPGWMTLALARSKELFAPNSPTPSQAVLHVRGGDHLAFGLTSNSSFETALAGNPLNQGLGRLPAFQFPFAAANQGGATQVLPYRRQSDGAIELGFEDIPQAGDNYIDEILVVKGTSLGAAAELGVTVAAQRPEVAPRAETAYQIKVRGSGIGDAILDSISNSLPPGFSYVPGSTRGATTANPQIAGRTLTWPGRFVVPAGGVAGVRFSVTASATEGTYLDSATADARGLEISPSGPSAQVRVVKPAAPPPGSDPPPHSDPAPVVPIAAGPRPPPPARVVARDVIKLPATKRCVSRRRFRIRMVKPKGTSIRSVSVKVNGRRVRTLKGRRVTARIDLRGLPKGRFTVKITVALANGRSLTSTRRYRTCAPRRRR